MPNQSFADFKDSFAYGSRNDLNFKFLAHVSEEEAADFFQELLQKLGDTIDDGNLNRLVDHVVAGQSQGYSSPANFSYDSGSFTPLTKPASATRIGLLTSTGHFVAGQDPEPFGVKDMTQAEAIERIGDFLKVAPELSEIPLDTPTDQLRVRHGGYDIRGAIADRNVALPLDRLRELESKGIIGTAISPAYSFVGATAQMRLLSKSGPAWVEAFQQANIEALLLVPV